MQDGHFEEVAGFKTLGTHGTQTQPAADVVVPMELTFVEAEFLSSGRLNEWESPALRGLLGKPLRESQCWLPTAQRLELNHIPDLKTGKPRQLHLYCQGCDLNAECHYGRVFEPDLLKIHGRAERGIRDGIRGISLATPFPGPMTSEPGQRMLIRLLAMGPHGVSLTGPVLQALAEYGEVNGMGPERARFRLDPSSIHREVWELHSGRLDRQLGRGVIPTTELILGSPLSLKGFDRREGPRPGFADIFNSALRTVTRVVRELGAVPGVDGQLLHDVDFRGLKEAALQVECDLSGLEWFEQSRSSRRQRQQPDLSGHWEFSGWSGSAVFRDVPAALIPWLQWAGRIGVGDSRVCGAGIWFLAMR